MLPGFQQSSELSQPSRDLHQLHGQFDSRCTKRGANDAVSARKVQKADREKLRRDRLNEQFSELGSVIDPDRTRSDKATILGDTIQLLKELTAEVKRLKNEQSTLMDESRDLTQEKNELWDEKATLKAEVDNLRGQYDQRLRSMVPWAPVDPTLMMGTTPFPYTLPMAPTSATDTCPTTTLQGSTQTPVMASPFVPIPMHPSFQLYPFFGSRSSDGTTAPYMAFPSFPAPVNHLSHVERPSAQYPSPMQPLPGFHVQPQTSAAASKFGKVSSALESGGMQNKAFAADAPEGHSTHHKSRSLSSDCRGSGDERDAKSTDLELKTPGLQSTASYNHQSDHSYASENQEQVQDVSSKDKDECHTQGRQNCVLDSASSGSRNSA